MKKMSRRRFLSGSIKAGAAISAGSAALGSSKLFAQYESKTAAQVDVAVVSSAGIPRGILDYNALSTNERQQYNEAVAQAADRLINILGGMQNFISRGDRVVIKPNLAFSKLMGHAVCTDPALVRRVAELCVDAGASRVVVTDNPCNRSSLTYQLSGLNAAFEDIDADNVEIHHPSPSDFISRRIGGSFLGQEPVYSIITDADKFINMPIAKTHSAAILTLGMKNLYGCLGGSRGAYHQQMNNGIVDMARYFYPTLTILDAVRILTAGGPTGGNVGDVRQLNTIVAGTDIVSVDSYATLLFDMVPDDLEYITIAHNQGLGRKDVGNLNVVKVEI